MSLYSFEQPTNNDSIHGCIMSCLPDVEHDRIFHNTGKVRVDAADHLLTRYIREAKQIRRVDQRMALSLTAGTDSQVQDMAGKSSLTATDEQRAALAPLAGSRDRGEADRARAVVLTLAGWTSPRIAEAFGVREDTVRLWHSDFAGGGIAALKASVAPGRYR